MAQEAKHSVRRESVMRRLASCLLLVVATTASAAQAPRAVEYAQKLDHALAGAADTMPRFVAAAEASADRLVAGGALWAGGSMPGFEIEAYYRAGGVCLTQRLKPEQEVARGDVVLYALLGAGEEDDRREVSRLRQAGATVVLFGSALSPAARAATFAIATGLEGHGLAVTLPDGRKMAPLDGVLNVANLWTYTAELVSALTRRGKMPTMFQSVMVEGARDRNKKYRPLRFHDDLKVDPIPAGQLGEAYLKGLRSHLATLLSPTGMAQLERAATLAATAKQAGHTLWAWMFGHYPPYVPGTPGDPGEWSAISGRVKAATLTEKLKPGDLLLHIGYTAVPTEELAAAKQAGAKSIIVVAGSADGKPPEGYDQADVWIDPGWVFGDAEISVPGYDIKVLPPSGVIEIAVFWMVVAETAAR